MKRFFRILLLAVVIASISGNAWSQNENKQRLTREELAEVQAKHIAKEISMDEAIGKRFVETFCRCQKEIWALGSRKNYRAKPINTTEEETKQNIKERFEHSKRILDIRQKYYEEYSNFMTQKQIKKVYMLERKIMNRLANKMNTRKR